MYIQIATHRFVCGSIVVMAVVFASLTTAQTVQDTKSHPDTPSDIEILSAVADTDIVNDETEETVGEENTVMTSTPVTDLGLQEGSDSGVVGDNITNNTGPTLSFVKVANSGISGRYRKHGGSWATVPLSNFAFTNSAGTATVRIPTLTAGDGNYDVEIGQEVNTITANVIYTFTLETARPTVTIAETTGGTVYAYADEITLIARTKDTVATGGCTDSTSTATGWSHYIPDGTTVTFSGSGRCFIFTDRAGNTKAAHTSAKVAGTVPSDHDSDDDNLIDITTHAKLNAVRNDLNGDGFLDDGADAAEFYTAFNGSATDTRPLLGCRTVCNGYELTGTIDLDTDGDGSAGSGDAYWNSGAGWSPIDNFTSIFNGDGYTVENLFISRSAANNQGLFGNLPDGGILMGVGVTDATVTGQHGVGALVGVMRAGSRVTTSYSTGTVTGEWSIGGLVGYNEGGTVEASYSGVTVTSTSTNVGGLVGLNNRATGSVKNSYAYGAVTTSASTNDKGGLVGKNSDNGTITASYWNSTATSATGSGTTGATGKTTTQLQSPVSYTSTAGNGATAIYETWDDSDIDGDGTNDAPWTFGTSSDYPTLSVQAYTVDSTPPVVTVPADSFNPRTTPVKFSEGGDVSVTLRGTATADGDFFGEATALNGDGTLLAVGAYEAGIGANPGKNGAVYLFEKSDGIWSQVLKIFNTGGSAGAGELHLPIARRSNFGSGVALSSDGTLLAVGARREYSYKGAVYLIEKSSGGTWSQTLKIFDKTGAAGAGELDISLPGFEQFGTSTTLSADGTLLAVGAYGNNSYRGAVYLFEKTGGTWSQTMKIFDKTTAVSADELDVDLDRQDFFGISTSISADGTLLAVGATSDDDGQSNSGAVYLFEKSGGTWSQILKISDNSGGAGKFAVDIDGGDEFGSSVSLHGTGRIVIGSRKDNDGGTAAGSVYIFDKKGDTWSQSLKISESSGDGKIFVDLDAGDYFGSGAALSGNGNTLAIGAERDDDGDGNNSGAVYLYEAHLSARSASISATDDEDSSDWEYVTVSDGVCGAAQFATIRTEYTEGSDITFTSESDGGKRVCFKTTDDYNNTSYTLSHPIKTIDRTAPTLTTTRIGTGSASEYRVSATDASPITGRTKDNTTSAACTTSTTTTGAGWTDYTPGEIVGTAHDTNGRCVIITDSLGHVAKQHLLDNDNTIQPPDTTAPVVRIQNAFNLQRNPIKISETGDIPFTLTAGDKFGHASAVSDDGTLFAVGSPYYDDNGSTADSGTVYLFEKMNGLWTKTMQFSKNTAGATVGHVTVSDLHGSNRFGTGVALSADGTVLAVGAEGDNGDGFHSGAVYLFEKTGGTWSQSLKIFDKKPADGAAGAGELDLDELGQTDFFGSSAALSADGTILAVGAHSDDDGNGNNSGSVYLFEKSGGTWAKTLKISENDGGTGKLAVTLDQSDEFGYSVAFNGDGTVLAVGARWDDSYGTRTNAGAVYLFEKSGGTWSQSVKMSGKTSASDTASHRLNLGPGTAFGSSVALSADGSTLWSGAEHDINSQTQADREGAVFIFKKSGNTWSNTARISTTGNPSVELEYQDFFGSSVSPSGSGILFVGAQDDDDGDGTNSGAVYIFDAPSARSTSVSATDNEDNSDWEYITVSDGVCGAAQFATTQTAYTEGSDITFSSESDGGKQVCFKVTDIDTNVSYALSHPIRTIDRTAPTLTTTRIGSGSSSEYRVRATDTSEPITGRTKDNVAAGSCTADTDTSGAGWSDYTLGTPTGTAHDTDGRCVIITDAAGNSAKQHLLDNDNTIAADFNLDLDASGTYEPNRDAILLYLYTNQGASASELTTFTDDGQTGTVASAIGKINAVKDSADTPLDMDGDGAFTANTDGIIPYLHSGQGYDATALVSFTHDNQQTTADAAITLVRGTVTPNWP